MENIINFIETYIGVFPSDLLFLLYIFAFFILSIGIVLVVILFKGIISIFN